MLVNTAWLRDYLDGDPTEADLLDAFMAAGLEIEECHALSEALAGVVVGFVREIAPLKDAPGMHACRIEIGPGQMLDVVCASEHPVEAGWGVPVAQAGTQFPTGMEVKEGKYHGVQSRGMICLDGEMGLVARTTGLQVFEDEAALGAPLPDVARLDEHLVDLSILPNRPDCLGMIGIAREVAAVLGVGLKYPCERTFATGGDTAGVTVHIEDPALCPRYLCRPFAGVRVAPSRHWLKSRLLTAGQRPINNVVDITNFVLLEWGQPLHAFDLDALRGNRIEVRRMRSGERLQLLDETEVDTSRHTPLVIADGERPVALAGIMGGSETQTGEGSTRILLEAACFDPVCVRESSKRLGISTNSSYRFERGTDPNSMLAGAVVRATQLLEDAELSGSKAGGVIEAYPEQKTTASFRLDAAWLSRFLGADVSAGDVRSSLARLEMECDADLNVGVPTWRVDVNDKVVLAEDVARMLRYDSIATRPMVATTTAGRANHAERLRTRLAEFLVDNGFLECRTPPLTSPPVAGGFNQWPGSTVAVQNPTTIEMTTLRQSLLGSLLEVVERNARRGLDSFRFFEIDRTFRHNDQIDERWAVAGVLGGPVNSAAWLRGEPQAAFRHVKGLAENLLARAGVDAAAYRAEELPSGYVPGESAAVWHGQHRLGTIGRVELAAVGLKDRARVPLYAFEFDVAALLAARGGVRRFAGLPRTQAVTRDISVAVAADIAYAQLVKSLQEAFHAAAGKLTPDERSDVEGPVTLAPRLEQVVCVDSFEGEKVGAGLKSLTIRLVFRDERLTLTSGEAQQLVESVVDRLQADHAAKQR